MMALIPILQIPSHFIHSISHVSRSLADQFSSTDMINRLYLPKPNGSLFDALIGNNPLAGDRLLPERFAQPGTAP